MGLYSGGLIIARMTARLIWGAYFQVSVYLGWLIIGILQYKFYLDIMLCISVWLSRHLTNKFMSRYLKRVLSQGFCCDQVHNTIP